MSRPFILLGARCFAFLLATHFALTPETIAQSSRRRAVKVPPPVFAPPAQGSVLRFFGTGVEPDEQAEIPSTNIDGKLTIEAWIRLDSRTSFPRIVQMVDPAGTWVAGITMNDEGRWMFTTRNGAVQSPEVAPTGTWTHVAGRATDTSLDLFVDGVQVGTLPINTPLTIPNAWFSIGNELQASMRQIRIWRAALTDSDVKRYAADRPEANDPRLIAWWPLDDGEAGRLTRIIRDLGPLAISYGKSSFQGRWVRPEILESGPYFTAKPLQLAGATRQEAGMPFPRFIDFDNDADLDVYTVHRMREPCAVGAPYFQGTPPQPDRAFRNDGSGLMVEASDAILLGDRIQGFLINAVGVADFTGDGRTDIFVTENGPECGSTPETYAYPNSLRVGTSSGQLDNQSQTRVPRNFDVDHRSAFGDIDGDRDIDAVSAAVGQDEVIFFVNDGSGVFFSLMDRTASAQRSLTSVALIDADLDGDLDLFGGDNLSKNGTNVLWMNDGTGHYAVAPASWLPAKKRGANITTVHTMPPVDLNGDGIMDLIASEQGIGYVGTEQVEPFLQVLLGNGDGSFRDGSSGIAQEWGSGPAGNPFGAALFFFEPFDQNGDGWTDLAIPAVGPDFDLSPPVLLINHGSAGFEDAGDLIPSDRAFPFVAVGDAEHDGDDDLVFDVHFLENIAPYRPNVFPSADLRVELGLTGSATLVENATAVNTGASPAAQVSMAIPVPQGFTWSQTNSGGGNCMLDRHIVVCTLSTLAAGGRWTVSVISQQSATTAATFAVASVTGDVNDPDRTNNRALVRLDSR